MLFRSRLVDSDNNSIDVDTDILGKTNYVSPNGVTFTNGLKIRFDSSVTPASYQDKEYYIEGVGTGIVLVLVDDLVINEAQSKPGYDSPSYFVSTANASLNQARDVLSITTTDFPGTGNIAVGTFPNTNNSSYIVPQEIELKIGRAHV